MNFNSDGSYRGLRRISICATLAVIALLAVFLVRMRREPGVVKPGGPRSPQYSAAEVEPQVRLTPPKPETKPEKDPLEKLRKAPQVQKSGLKSDPLASISNPIFSSAGQGDGRFTIRDQNVSAWFTDRGVTLAALLPERPGDPNLLALKWGLVGAQAVEPRPEGELVTRINQFIGPESQWKRNLPSYSRINYDEAMPGVDVTIDSKPHALKYTVRLAAGVDPSVLQFRYEGADSVDVSEDGKSLQVVSALGSIPEGQLEVWQESGGARIPIAARYEKTGPNEYAIRVDAINPELPLTVDPTFSWGTFIGGSQTLTGGTETGYCIVTDVGDNPYVGGTTASADFPASAGVMQKKTGGSSDGFVAKFTDTCAMVWATYIGGNAQDIVYGIKLDSLGNVVVVGTTQSYNFPTFGPVFQPTYPVPLPATSTVQGFVAKLDGGTAQLIWSSYYGGNAVTQPVALAIDTNNDIYIAGSTQATNLPARGGSYQPSYSGGTDAFAAKIKGTGTAVLYSTYLGGVNLDQATCIDVDVKFQAYVGGFTNGGYPASVLGTPGGYDGFVTKLNSAGSGIIYSRIIAGTGEDRIKGIAVDNFTPEPYCYITGYSALAGTNWPVNFGPPHAAGYDAFVTRIDYTGGFLNWSRNIGGNGSDYGYGIVYDFTYSDVYLTGTTTSTDFPCTNGSGGTILAYKTTISGSSDIWCSKVSATNGAPIWTTYFGGLQNEDGNAVCTTGGWFWVTGFTSSTNYPTTSGAWSGTLNSSSDAIVTRLNPYVAGAGALYASTFLGGTHGVASTYNAYYRSMGVDSAGNVAIGGYTNSINYPDTAGTIITPPNNATGLYKAVITKLPADGSATSPPMWSTYLGGTNSDFLYSVTMNAAGDVFATGYTYSTDFPTKNAYRNTMSGSIDVFVTRIQSDGAALVYSTFLGGSDGDEYGEFIAVDSNNNCYVAGEVYSTDFPWLGTPVKKVLGGGQDAFVSKFNSAGSLVYSTYLGGDNAEDYPTGLAVDNLGFAYIVGNTSSFDYPIFGGLGYVFDGYSCFLTKLNTTAASYGYSTFIDGSSNEYPTSVVVDQPNSLVLSSAIVGGYTYSTDFPASPGAFQPAHHGGGADGFVIKVSPAGNSIDWCTYLGGSSSDIVQALALDAASNVYVTGYTQSSDFPMTAPLLNFTYAGSNDVFVTRINAGGSIVPWSTFLGGKGNDVGYSVSVGPGGNVYVGGTTTSPDFFTTGGVNTAGSFSPTRSGNSDLFVVKINNDPPSPPASLGQYRSNGATPIVTGGATNEPSVIMKGVSSDPEGDAYKLQIEVRPIGVAFTSPATITVFNVDFFDGGTFVPAGSTAQVTVTGRTNPTQYHWQARSVDAGGAASAWVAYGGNPESVSDFRVDTVLPTLSISQANPTYTQGTTIALSGPVSDDVSIFNVQWTNSTTSTSFPAMVIGGTSWNSGSITLQSGVTNVIIVQVTDSAGNVNATTQQISVVQDSTPPVVSFNAPLNVASIITKTSPLTVTGTWSDLNGVTGMSWQNVASTTTSGPIGPVGNSFTTSIVLSNGVNGITVFATDPAGNTGQKFISVTYDPQPPTIIISTPGTGTIYTNATSMVVTGTAADAITSVSQVTYTVNGSGATLAGGTPTSWSFTLASLVGGDNVVNVNATDAATNVSLTASVDIFRDPFAPTMTINSNPGPPAWGTNPTSIITNQPSIAFTGTAVDDPSFKSDLLDVRWTNSLPATFGTAIGTTNWNTGTIGLLPGTNNITITVRDKALNSFSRAVSVVYDNQVPIVTILVPTSSGAYLTSATSIDLSGSVTDAGGSGLLSMAWSTTGAVAPNSGTLTFAGTSWPPGAGLLNVPLAGGAQTITISASDNATNSGVSTIVVTRDITPPALLVTTPAVTPFYTTSNSVGIGGSASDASGIQSVTYTLNGTGPFPTVGGTSWSATVSGLSAGDNTIVITAKDNSNLTTPVTIHVFQDTTPPTVAITSPPPPSFVTKNSTLLISGTASDAVKVATVQWSIGGGFTDATLVGSAPNYTWNASILLGVGNQTVTVRAVDGAGNISSPNATLSVTLDQTGPQINFTTPTTAITFLTSSPQLPAVSPPPAAIAGTATDNVAVASIEYFLNGVGPTLIVGATTSFTVPTVLLTAGSNTIDIRATDTAGNQTTKTMTVTYDNVPPTVSIGLPQPSGIYYTAAPTVTLSGSALDANGINKIEWRNNHPPATPGTYAVIPGATTSWTTPAITLDPLNDNAIDIRATDNAGNTNVSTLTVRVDTTKPVITVTAPPAVTKNNSITISGTSSDTGGAGVTGISWTRVEGSASGVVLAPFAAWSTSVPLANGTNTITFTATDGAGNTQAAAAVVVVLDTTNPTVTITTPTSASPYYTNQAFFNLGGSATDNVAVQTLQYQINGGTLNPVLPVNPWTLTNVPVSVSGTTIVNLIAADTATNTGSKSITVITDTAPPLINVTPPSPSVVNTTSVIITGTASDALSGINTVTWTRTEGGATGTATYTGPGWTATVPLVAGTNTFTFTANDVAGNSTPAGAVVVTRDNVNPVPVITAPGFPTYATSNSILSAANLNALAGTASDNIGLSKVEYRLNSASPAAFILASGTTSWSVPSITLTQPVNTIDVLATDSAGNTGMVTLTVTLDTTPPVVAITTPVLGTLGGGGGPYNTGSSSVSIGGTASDAVGIQRIDWSNTTTGVSGSTTGTSWSISIPVQGGPNSISVRAVDTAGNLSTPDTLTVNLNTAVPVVTITTPTTASSFATANTPITISGTSSHSTGITKLEWRNFTLTSTWTTISDGLGLALASSAFSFAPALTVPTNVIEVQATPTAGFPSIGTITILYDTTDPTVDITTPTNLLTFVTKTSPILLAGPAGATGVSGLASVVWVNAATSGTQNVTSTSWTSSVSLTPGANPITVTAKSGAGKTASKTLTVTYDLTPPTVNITGPTTNSTYLTTASTILLAGTASDNVALASVKYQINGSLPADVTPPMSNWTVPGLPLGAGTGVYVINVIATDTAGNTSTDTLTVTRDNDNPTLTIASPANNTFTNSSPIVVTGTATDNQGLASVTWSNAANSTNGTASGTTNWTASGITLVAGSNVITVRATDTLGNFLTKNVTVNYDITVPVVDIALPTSGPTWATNALSIDLSGTVTDNDLVASVSATNAANNITVVDVVGAYPAWSTTGIALLPGANAITVTATDRSGNTSTKVITVTLDNTKPTVAVTSPVATGGTYVTGASTLQISGTAADDLAVQKVDWVNGAVFGTAAGTTNWTATVPLLAGSNTVSFTATDSAGNTSTGPISITVIRDTAIPSISIGSPVPGFITKLSPITVSGTAMDLQGLASVTWANAATGGSGTATNGSAAGGVTTGWSASIPLAIGTNLITVTAADTSGNETPDTVTVTLDIAAPSVTITSPTSGLTWIVPGSSVALGGTTTDNVGLQSVSVTNSALPGTTPADISTGLPGWSIPAVPLGPGANILTVTSTDKAGNTATAMLTVTSDGTAPGVAITSPIPSGTFYTNVANVSLGGTASDNVGVQKVDWTNALTSQSGTAVGTTIWSVSVPLALGSNLITFTSTDTAGTVSAVPATITVVYDTTLPAIAVTAPTLNTVPTPPTYTTNLGPVAFGGTVTDNSGVSTVTWTNSATGGSGSAIVDTVPATPTWSVSVPVASGLNTVVFTATDLAGNKKTTTVNVTFDAIPPSVTITSPTPPSYITNAASVVLMGTAGDNVGIQSIIWVNAAGTAPGNTGSAGAASPWTTAAIPLVPGDNPINVTVTDLAGNTASGQIVVRQDNIKPTVAFTSPVPSGTFLTNLAAVTVSGTASDDVAVAGVTVNGVPATGTSSWTAVVNLSAGANVITAVATDSAGNVNAGSVSITVTRDTTPPIMDIAGHLDGDTFSTVTSSVTLTGNASDPGGALQTVSWSNTSTGGSGTAVLGGGTWNAPIALTPGTNTIIITTRDSAGNITQETLTIIHDTQAPTISINTPTASSTYNTKVSPIVLGGGAADNVNVKTVTWTNSSTGATGGTTGTTTAWIASVPLNVGSNTITVVATDDVGNSAIDTITVTYDFTAPTITITTPTALPTYSTTQTPLTFSGTASDDLDLASITWDNQTAGAVGSATGTVAWTAAGVPLISGVNKIVFTATDGVGNVQVATIFVTYDVTAPVVVITPPTTPTQVRPLLLAGTVDDNIGVASVTWSNNLTGASGTAVFTPTVPWVGPVPWSASIPMIPGQNVITVKATDGLGNIGTSSVSVDYSHEMQLPDLIIVSPTPPTFMSPLQVVTVSGTATDNVGVTVVSWINKTTRVYGVATYVAPDWTADVPLANGPNDIEFAASDDVANVDRKSITISFVAPVETNPPTITITAPTSLDTFDVTSSPLQLEASAIDDVGVVSVTWTNQGTFGSGDSGWGSFWYTSIPLVSGTNLITVTATDTSGNTSSDTITVYYTPPVGDPVPPIVNITSPSTGTLNVSVPVVNLIGTASDNNMVQEVTYSNTSTNRYATANGTTSWSADGIALDPGVNVITARAVDPAGNIGKTTLVVVYTPPVGAKPIAPFIPAGMCGLTGLESLLVLGALWLRRRGRRSSL